MTIAERQTDSAAAATLPRQPCADGAARAATLNEILDYTERLHRLSVRSHADETFLVAAYRSHIDALQARLRALPQ
ncbi:MAG: hypothetical protein AAF515_06220 [Pseudomonadota bacterium]